MLAGVALAQMVMVEIDNSVGLNIMDDFSVVDDLFAEVDLSFLDKDEGMPSTASLLYPELVPVDTTQFFIGRDWGFKFCDLVYGACVYKTLMSDDIIALVPWKPGDKTVSPLFLSGVYFGVVNYGIINSQ